MKKASILIWSFFIVAGFFLPAYADEVSDLLYNQGVKNFIQKDYDGAVKNFSDAYALDKDNSKLKAMYSKALVKKAGISYENKKLEEAYSLYSTAVSVEADAAMKQQLTMARDQIKKELLVIEEEEARQAALEEARIAAEEARKATEAADRKAREAKEAAEAEVRAAAKKAAEDAAEKAKLEADKVRQELELKQIQQQAAQEVELARIQGQLEAAGSAPEFDVKGFITEQNNSTNQVIEQLLKSQDERLKAEEAAREADRELIRDNIQSMAEQGAQAEESFNKRMMIILIAAGALFLIVLVVIIIIVAISRGKPVPVQGSGDLYGQYEMRNANALGYDGNTMMLTDGSAGPAGDGPLMLEDDRYTEVVRAKRLGKLKDDLKQGKADWDSVSTYVNELNFDMKAEILSMVENKLKDTDTSAAENIIEVLLPLITDEDEKINEKSKKMMKSLSGPGAAAGGAAQLEAPDDFDFSGDSDPLTLNSLNKIARMISSKTGRVDNAEKVAELAFRMADKLSSTEFSAMEAQKVGLIHDVGFLEMPDEIFEQQDSLTEDQFAMIKTHTFKGVGMFKDDALPQVFVDGILYHHERLDGSGYPDGLIGNEIPQIARLIAVADFFVAVTSYRPYRKQVSVSECIEMMDRVAGQLLDAEMVDVLHDIYRDEL